MRIHFKQKLPAAPECLVESQEHAMVGSLFGTSSVPLLHFQVPPPNLFSESSPITFTVTLSINHPVTVRVSLLTSDYQPHFLTISPQQSIHFSESATHKQVSQQFAQSSYVSDLFDAEPEFHFSKSAEAQEQQRVAFRATETAVYTG